MPTVRMMNWTSFGHARTCTMVGDLVRETPKFYVFTHAFFTAGEERRVGQAGVYHVTPCKYCADFGRSD